MVSAFTFSPGPAPVVIGGLLVFVRLSAVHMIVPTAIEPLFGEAVLNRW